MRARRLRHYSLLGRRIPPRSFGALVPRPGAVVSARFFDSVCDQDGVNLTLLSAEPGCANKAARVATPARELGAANGTTGTPGRPHGRGSEPVSLEAVYPKRTETPQKQTRTRTDPWRLKEPARRRAPSLRGARAAAARTKKPYRSAARYARRRGPRPQPRARAFF